MPDLVRCLCGEEHPWDGATLHGVRVLVCPNAPRDTMYLGNTDYMRGPFTVEIGQLELDMTKRKSWTAPDA